MPLHLDLHHEISQQERERKRDPLKIGMLCMAVIAIGCVGFYLVKLNGVRTLRGELGMLRTEWSTLEGQQEAAKAREIELKQERALAETLQGSIDSRFFWAPFLQLLGQSVPPNVQIIEMEASIPAEGSLVVSLEGIAAGDQPRQVAEDFRIGLEKSFLSRFSTAEATFSALEEGSVMVEMGGRELETAKFTITMEVNTEESAMVGLPDKRLTTLAENFES